MIYRAFKKPIFVVVDQGIGVAHASRLVNEGYTVYYYVPWQKAFPTYKDYLVGEGFGMIKIKDPLEPIMDGSCDMSDVCYFFTDIGFGHLAEYLRENDIKVFGAPGNVEVLELDRKRSKEILTSLGIDVTDAVFLRGRSELEKYYDENPGEYYIKLSSFRGDLETTFISDKESLNAYLDKLAGIVGPCIEVIDFALEVPVSDAVEVGCDIWFNGTDYSDLCNTSFEIKANNIGYFCPWREWKPFVDMLNKLKPFLQKNNYRGIICFEGMWDGEKIRIHDPCIRHSFPLSSSYPVIFDRWGEFIYDVACGNDLKVPVRTDCYYGVINVYSDAVIGCNLWLPLEIPEELMDRICFRSNVIIDGKYYAIPDAAPIVSVVEDAKDIEELCKKLTESYNKLIPGTRGTDVKGDIYPEVKKVLDEYKRYGIDFVHHGRLKGEKKEE